MSLEKAFCQLRHRRGCGFPSKAHRVSWWRGTRPTDSDALWWETPLSAAAWELGAATADYRHKRELQFLYLRWGPKRKGCQYSTCITSGASASSVSQTPLKDIVSCQSNTTAEMPKHHETATTAWVSLGVIKYSANIQGIPKISSVLGSFPRYMHSCWKWMTSFINTCFRKYLIHFGCVYVLSTVTAINQCAGKTISQKRQIFDGY